MRMLALAFLFSHLVLARTHTQPTATHIHSRRHLIFSVFLRCSCIICCANANVQKCEEQSWKNQNAYVCYVVTTTTCFCVCVCLRSTRRDHNFAFSFIRMLCVRSRNLFGVCFVVADVVVVAVSVAFLCILLEQMRPYWFLVSP